MQIKPLSDQVLIRPLGQEQTTPAGIVIPDTAQKKPQQGEIVAVGPGKLVDGKRIALEVKVGEKVYYKKWGGNEIKVEGEEFLLVKEEDILAVID